LPIFLGQSADKATAEDVRRYQLWLASIGTTVPTVNVSATALRFFFKVTLKRHAHIIVPGGGFSPNGQHWIACRPDFFLSVRVLSRLFRRLFLERLTAAYQAGRLEFFADQATLAETAAFQARLAALRKLEWVVYAKRPFGGPDAVLTKLSRYTHRIAIANSRLVAFDGERVASNGSITGPRATPATSL
jgi:Putative transposase